MTEPYSSRRLRAAAAFWDEVEIERVASMTIPELDDELRSQGLDPDEEIDLERLLPPAPETIASAEDHGPPEKSDVPSKAAPVVHLPRRSRWNLWLVAASFAALGVCAVVAAVQPNPTTRVAGNGEGPQPTPSAVPSNVTKAEALRFDAGRACSQQLWGACAQKLDDAKVLDPAGERQERVIQWRVAIARHTTGLRPGANVPEQFFDSKTGPGAPPQKP